MPIGTSKVGALGGLVPGGTITFNTSGTWTVPPGVKKISVEGTGGAGNPGNSGNSGNAGNPGEGGGGGGAATSCVAGPQMNSTYPYVSSTNTRPQWPDPGGNPTGSRRRGGLGGGGALGGVSTGAFAGACPGFNGSAGTGGSAGNPGNTGQNGQATTAFTYNFAGGNAGTGGNGGNAGTGGAAGNGGTGQSTSPPVNPRAGGTQGGGSGGGGGTYCGPSPFGPACTITFIRGYGSGGGGAGAINNGGNAPQANPALNAVSNPGAGGTPGGGSGGKGRYYGYVAPPLNLVPGSDPPFPSVCAPFSSKGNPAGVTRAGGGGAGGTGSTNGNQAGGGGGGRGAAGNCGGGGNPGNPGNAGTNTTYNCVPVTPGGSYPIVVGGPSGGSVVISWNPQ